MSFNKFLFVSFFFVIFFSFQQAQASSDQTYSIKGKDLTIKVTQVDVYGLSGLRNNEGIINIEVQHKKKKINQQKDVRLTVVCSDDNYYVFSDICNKDYTYTGSPLNLNYLLNDNRSHNFNFQFAVGKFKGDNIGDDEGETINYVLEQDIPIKLSVLSKEIKIISPKSKSTIKANKDFLIKWTPYIGDFDSYSVHLENKLVPNYATYSREVLKSDNQFTYSSEFLTGAVDNYVANSLFHSSQSNSKSNIAKNFYFVVEAFKNGDVVSSAESPIFKIKK
jgi:hypothetical protein